VNDDRKKKMEEEKTRADAYELGQASAPSMRDVPTQGMHDDGDGSGDGSGDESGDESGDGDDAMEEILVVRIDFVLTVMSTMNNYSSDCLCYCCFSLSFELKGRRTCGSDR
jgi:hypothetical protein